MLDSDTRWVILCLRGEAQCELQTIARMLGVDRATVARVLAEGTREPPWRRPEVAAPYKDRIAELYGRCGNLAQVRRELAAEGVVLAPSTLARFCQRHGIGGAADATSDRKRRLVRLLQNLVSAFEGALPPPSSSPRNPSESRHDD